jgi:hypothetical protein
MPAFASGRAGPLSFPRTLLTNGAGEGPPLAAVPIFVSVRRRDHVATAIPHPCDELVRLPQHYQRDTVSA